jgi:hypothetical protein
MQILPQRVTVMVLSWKGFSSSDVARRVTARLARSGDNKREHRADCKVNSGQRCDDLQGVGEIPARPAIPSKVECAEYERQRDGAGEQMQS